MLTIGEKLAKARQEIGLSIEDVAYETHIPPTTVLNIESDDFSAFPSVAYARSFIRKYADYLDIDVTPAMTALDSGVTRLGENELMEEMKKTIRKDSRFRLESRPKAVRRKLGPRRRAPLLLNAILFAVVAALGVFYFLGFNAATPEEAKSEITRGIQRAIPFGEDGSAPVEPTAQEVEAPAVAVADDLLLPENPIARPVEQEVLPAPELVEKEEIALEPSAETPAETPATSTPEIAKPVVQWEVDRARPRPLAPAVVASRGEGEEEASATIDAPAIRRMPAIEIEDEFDPVVPIQSADLPALQQAREEPSAILRPAGTDPARREDSGTTGSADAPALRAVPMANSR